MVFNKSARNRRRLAPCPLEIQSLEHRRLLAADIVSPEPDGPLVIMPTSVSVDGGTVAVTTSRGGDLILIGDGKPNTVNFRIQGTTLLLDGGDATSFRLPGQAPQSALELPLPATIRSITISLSSGNDQLNIQVFSDVTVNRDLSVNLGTGDDSLTLQVVNADLRVNQNLTVDLSAGDDGVDVFTADAASILVGRDMNMRAGNGNDDILVGDDDFVDIDTLYEIESFTGLEDNSEIPLNQRIRAGRDVNINLGAGNDALTLLNTESGRDLSIAAASGTDVLVASNLRSARNAAISEAESTALQNLTVVGNLNIGGSFLADKFSLDRLTANRLEIDLGSGSDELSLGESVSVNRPSIVRGGGGTNAMYSGKAQPLISFRRITPSLTSEQSLELLIGVLEVRPGESGGITPFQAIMAE